MLFKALRGSPRSTLGVRQARQLGETSIRAGRGRDAAGLQQEAHERPASAYLAWRCGRAVRPP